MELFNIYSVLLQVVFLLVVAGFCIKIGKYFLKKGDIYTSLLFFILAVFEVFLYCHARLSASDDMERGLSGLVVLYAIPLSLAVFLAGGLFDRFHELFLKHFPLRRRLIRTSINLLFVGFLVYLAILLVYSPLF